MSYSAPQFLPSRGRLNISFPFSDDSEPPSPISDGEKRLEEKNNNQNHNKGSTSATATKSQSRSVNYEECYEFIGLNKKKGDESSKSLVILRRQTDICKEQLSVSSPKVGGVNRKRKPVSSRVVAGHLKSSSNNAGESEVGLGGTKKERKALLQKLRQQEISRMKKALRDRLPDHIRTTTKLGASSLSGGLRLYCADLQSEIENLQFEFYRAERRNIILRRKLADLVEDKSNWPYEITETSDKITIRKQCDTFVF